MARGGAQRIPRPPSVIEGPVPSWFGKVTEAESLGERDVRALVTGTVAGDAPVEVPDGWREAAVLVPFAMGEDGLEVLFVRRRDDLPTHAGEVAFPGGTRSPADEDLTATALRETHEETGLERSLVHIVGRGEPVMTFVTRFAVTPFFGWVSDPDRDALVPEEREILSLLWVPVTELVHPDAYSSEHWEFEDRALDMHFFLVEGETIWGMTARILAGILDRMLGD